MEDDAGAGLETVLAGGVETRPQIIGFDAEGYERFERIINAAAKLKGEPVSA